VAGRFGGDGDVGTGGGHVEVWADDEPELPQVGPQYRYGLVGGGFPDLGALHRAESAQFDLPAACTWRTHATSPWPPRSASKAPR
jgi:hypothetical protein